MFNKCLIEDETINNTMQTAQTPRQEEDHTHHKVATCTNTANTPLSAAKEL